MSTNTNKPEFELTPAMAKIMVMPLSETSIGRCFTRYEELVIVRLNAGLVLPISCPVSDQNVALPHDFTTMLYQFGSTHIHHGNELRSMLSRVHFTLGTYQWTNTYVVDSSD